MTELFALLLLFIIALLASFPLYLAVKFVGGRTTLLKTLFVNIAVGLVLVVIQGLFHTYGQILSFIIAIIIYMKFFRIGILRALLLGIVEFIVIILLLFLAGLLGLGFLLFLFV